MSYLDELKKQAEELKAGADAERRKQAELEARFRQQVQPSLKKLFFYQREMVKQLNYIKPDVSVTLDFKGAGLIKEIKHDQYLITPYDEAKDCYYLRITMKLPRKVGFSCDNIGAMKIYNEYLWENNIRFEYNQVSDVQSRFLRGDFIFDSELIAELAFSADYNNSGIKLQLRNFEQIGRREYVFKPEHITDEFLDGFAQYVTRVNKNPEFMEQFAVERVWWLKNVKIDEKLKREKLMSKLSETQKPHENPEYQAKLQRLQEQKLKRELMKLREEKTRREEEEKAKQKSGLLDILKKDIFKKK